MLDVSNEDLSKFEKKFSIYREYVLRFFIIYADGSGTELLRYQDIAEYLINVEQSFVIVVLKDELVNFLGVIGIIILKLYIGGLLERWLKKYDQEFIIFYGIRCRDLIILFFKEFKIFGFKFGVNLG